MCDSNADRNAVEILAEEFVERYRNGDRPPLSEYIQRFPEHAEEIKDLFPALLLMENLKPAEDDDAAANHFGFGAPSLNHLGDYRIIREVGRGGMGIVYEAEQVSLGRHVALKVLPKELLDNPKRRLRFEREAKAAAKLHHTNIVPVFGVGEEGGTVYYVMQFIQGLALDEVLLELKRLNAPLDSTHAAPLSGELRVVRREVSAADVARSLMAGSLHQSPEEVEAGAESGLARVEPVHDEMGTEATLVAPSNSAKVVRRRSDTFSISNSSVILPGTGSGRPERARKATYWQSVAQIGVQVAQALEYAHGQGVLHRDIKASNLLLDLHGTVWVTDFGLAKIADEGEITQTGDILGTLRYMAPETFKGQADARSEVYSLGLTLYELLAFRPAFDQTQRSTLVDQVMSAQVERLGKRNPAIPTDLQTIVHKAIARDPADRYQTAQEFADDLRRFIDDEPIKARRIAPVERLLRWSRHNRGLAASLATVSLLITVLAIGSTIAAGYFQSLNRQLGEKVEDLKNTTLALTVANADKDKAKSEAEREATENLRLANEAEAARRASQTTLADIQTERGLSAAAQGDAAAAMLWFANAAEQTPHDPRRQDANRLRARNWMGEAMLPVASLHFPSHGPHRRLAFQPFGRFLLVFKGTSFLIWDWQSQASLPWPKDLQDVGDVCWSPDGQSIAIGTRDGDVQVRSVPDGNVVHRIKHSGSVETVEFSPNGERLAIAGTVVQVWRLSGNPVVENEWPHPNVVAALRFDRAGNRLVTASVEKEARVFAVGEGPATTAPLYTVPHEPGINRISPVFLDGDRKLMVLPRPGQLAWFDAASGKDVTPPGADAFPPDIRNMAASPDGRTVVVSTSKSAEFWRADGHKRALPHVNHVNASAFSPDGSSLVTASWDWNVRVWSPIDGDAPPTTMPQMEVVEDCTFAPDGTTVAACGPSEVRVWKRTKREVVVGRAEGWDFRFWRPRVGSDGRFATPGAWHEGQAGLQSIRTVSVIETRTGKEAGPPIHVHDIVDSCIGSDNVSVALAANSGPSSGKVLIHEIATGRERISIHDLPANPHSIAARPGHSQLAVLCKNGTVLVVDQRTGTRLQEHLHEALSTESRHPRVTYTPDGQALITVTFDSNVVVRDAENGQLRFPPIRPILRDGPCRALAVSTDSRWLATGVNGQNAVQVWDLATGTAVSPPLPHPGDLFGIFSVVFSPDGRWVLSGDKDGRARLWDWRTGKLVCPPLQHSDEVLDVAFTADGRHVLTAIRNGTTRLWDVTTGKLVAAPINYPCPPQTSTETLTVIGDRVIAGAHEYPILDVSQLLAEPEQTTKSLQAIAELASGGRLELGELNQFSADEWRERWAALETKPYSTTSAVESLARELDEDRSSASQLWVAERAAKSGLLEELLRERPDVFALHGVAARLLAERGDVAAAVEHRRRAVTLCERRLAEQPDDSFLVRQLTGLILDANITAWSPLKPMEIKSEGGTTFIVRPDGAILANQIPPASDTYVVTGRTERPRIAAIRLDVLTDSHLPDNGPGLSEFNFHLTEVKARLQRAGGETVPLTFVSTASDYERPMVAPPVTPRDGPWAVIDGDDATRWDIYPEAGKPHWLALRLDAPAELAPDDRLVIRLEFRDPLWARRLLGCFRLFVSDDVRAVENYELQRAVVHHAVDRDCALAVAYLIDNKPERALEILSGASGSAARLILEARARQELGQADGAREPCRKLAEMLKLESLAPVLKPEAAAVLTEVGGLSTDEVRALFFKPVFDHARAHVNSENGTKPESVAKYQQHAIALARIGAWRECAESFRHIIKLDEDYPSAWLCVAAPLLLNGDDDEYLRHSRSMLEQFRGNDQPFVVDAVCKVCLLRPGTVELSALPIQRLREAAEDPQLRSLRPWFTACCALFSYREGHFKEALDWTNKTGTTRSYAGTLSLAVRAMSEHQLGLRDEALRDLATVDAAIPAELSGLGTNRFRGLLPVPVESVNTDWQIAEVLRREADALILGARREKK